MPRLIDANNPYIPKYFTEHDKERFLSGLVLQPAIDPAPQWIPVTERLPEDTDDVLVYTNKVTKARYGCDGWHGQGGRWTNVTHWMPLPEPPEDGGAEND